MSHTETEPSDALLTFASGCVIASAVALVLAFDGVMPRTTGNVGAALLAIGLAARFAGGRL